MGASVNDDAMQAKGLDASCIAKKKNETAEHRKRLAPRCARGEISPCSIMFG